MDPKRLGSENDAMKETEQSHNDTAGIVAAALAVASCARVPEKYFFDTTRQIIQLRPDRQGGGGVPDIAPSPKRHTTSYTKPNTGDGR